MQWRLIVDAPGDGARNMSVDEALLSALQQGLAPITLRFYRWQPPTVSLGYFQDAREVNLKAIERLGLGLVRRPTGGRAILHDDELTYSIVLPADAIPGGRSVGRSYLRISRALLAGLEILGIKAGIGSDQPSRSLISPGCFALSTRADIAVEGRKVIGSAQVRRSGFILQHGAIVISIDADKHTAAFGPEEGRAVASSAVGIAELLGRRPSWNELIRAFVVGFEKVFAIRLCPGELSSWEREQAHRLKSEKYAADSFTLHAPAQRSV